MIAVLSATEHDFYAMPLPFAVYSWMKAGARSVIVFTPAGSTPKLNLAQRYCDPSAMFLNFKSEEKRTVTYSQVIRLFAGCIKFKDTSESMVTGDSDMCVFGDEFIKREDSGINIFGADLTPLDQVPMCYIQMPIYKWRDVMGCYNSDGELRTYQESVAELIDPIEGQNIRGEQWSYDQWYANKMLRGRTDVLYIERAKEGTQFATRRADRDGWHFDPYNILDAHLPRPLTDEENFNKVYELFKIKYPEDDLQWMIDYRNEYLLL